MNKKKIIIILITVILSILLVGILIYKIKNDNKDMYVLNDVFEIEDIENSNYKIKKSKNKRISSELESLLIKKRELIELDANVKLNENIGVMLYARGKGFREKANIFQIKYKVKNTNDVKQIIDSFTTLCISYLDVSYSIIPNGLLIKNDIKSTNEVTSEEAIYNKQGIYKIKFESTKKDKENKDLDRFKNYTMYFYMNKDNLICELVKIF